MGGSNQGEEGHANFMGSAMNLLTGLMGHAKNAEGEGASLIEQAESLLGGHSQGGGIQVMVTEVVEKYGENIIKDAIFGKHG